MTGAEIPLAVQLVGAAAVVGGTTASIVSANNAQRDQRKADAVARAQAALENKRSIRQAINSGRVQRAQLSTAAGSQGAGDSSGLQGALGSAQTQESANIGFARQTAASGASINRHLGRARQSLANAASFGAIANLPGQFGLEPFSGVINRGPKDPAPKSFGSGQGVPV